MSRKHSESRHSASVSAHSRPRKLHRRSLAWLWIGLAALLVAGAGILLLRPKNAPVAGVSPISTVPGLGISVTQAYAEYQQGGTFFLDVRTQEEWDQFHLAKSTLIPLDQLSQRLGELPRDKAIVVVCLSGHRSQSGATLLQQAGFTHLAYMIGGLQAWQAAGYPLVAAAQ